MATMKDLDKDRNVIKRTVKEKGPLTKAFEDLRSRKAEMSRQQSEEGVTSRMGGMGSMKNADAGSGRGTTSFDDKKTFKQAFREARDAGKETFTWNGKKYTTEMEGEKKRASEPETKAERETSEYDFGTTNPSEFKRGGSVNSSVSKRADGCCIKGKTRGKVM